MSNSTTKNTRLTFVELLTQHRSPTSIAAGVATGLAMGLLPRDSALVLVFLGFIAFMPMNQLFACITAVLASLLSVWLAPLVHLVGYQVLNLPMVSGFVVSLYSLPLVPWFRLENTLVAGGLVCGLVSWLPSFLLARRFCRIAEQTLQSHQVYELAAAALRRQRGDEDSLRTTIALSTPNATLPAEPKDETSSDVTPIVGDNGSNPIEVKTMVDAKGKKTTGSPSKKSPKTRSDQTVIAFEDSILRETVIEVVRYKRPHLDGELQGAAGPHSDTTLPTRDTMSIASSSSVSNPSNMHQDASPSTRTIDRVSPDGKALSVSPTTIHVVNHLGNKEESLRHILKHIHGTRESRKSSEKSA